MTYFRTGAPYYHRRAAVSRSCSGWEGVVPAGYGRQALSGEAAARGAWAAGGKVRRGCAVVRWRPWGVVHAVQGFTMMESSRTDY
jgi:hypothetical protein